MLSLKQCNINVKTLAIKIDFRQKIIYLSLSKIPTYQYQDGYEVDRVLITGGLGKQRSRIARKLLHERIAVVIADNFRMDKPKNLSGFLDKIERARMPNKSVNF